LTIPGWFPSPFFEACFEAREVVYLAYLHKRKEETAMKNTLSQVVMFVSRIRSEHVQMFFAVLALATLVLGVSAPSDGGGATRR
jgi:hypothetical protein